ncbi:MAG: HAMP domain-containing protein [Ruminococcaceae bacterium]|nr:HAMP domain-containing protein [Oscillospiraceae bacterium]
MRKNTVTLRNSMWRSFVLFTVIIFVMLWVFQIMLFNAYYVTMKKEEISQMGEKITLNFKEASKKEFGLHNFDSNLERHYFQAGKVAFEGGVTMHMFDAEGEIISRDEMGKFHGERRINPNEVATVKSKIKKGEINKPFTLKDGNFRTNVIANIASLDFCGERIYFYIKTPMIPMDTTVKVLRNQLIMCTITSLIIAFIASYLLSNRIVKPIKNMTNSAKVLATGNYNVEFEGARYKEICELSDALNYAATELSKTDTLRRDLMANVSHDLKTPLTIIKSYAEMIRDLSGDNPEKRTVHTQVIIDETDRLTDLVSDILDLSKLESGTVSMKKENFDFSKTVYSILDNFKILEENEGYVFKTDIEDGLIVLGNERKISQVIYNLINNAVNYTGEDKIIAVKVSKNEDKVRFEVTDTGVGIDEKDIDKVWERYYKSSRTHKRLTKGTGIGLSIVKNILTEHESSFGVISKKGEGSTFWFEL